ncbi:MAG: hypothetical protein WC848_06165 [Parcubacteria group bacterium]
MKKKLKFIFTSSILSILLLLASLSCASEVPFDSSSTQDLATPVEAQKAIAIATVNIYNTKLVSQDNSKLKISFQLSNREKAQPAVKYAVQLIGKEAESQYVADEQIYPEVISLGEHETASKEIEYLAPNYLTGTFRVLVVSRNENGLPFSFAPVGEVVLQGEANFLEILPNSCFLTVEGEVSAKKYTIRQGVDIKSEETLLATCNIINHFPTAISFTPSIETHRRITVGELVPDNNEPQKKLSLGAGEKKSFSLSLPKATAPQAYDAVLKLKDSTGTISNQVAFHYVIRGASATIQNLILDKNFYQKGEIVNTTLFFSGSAEGFPGSRFEKEKREEFLMNMEIKDAAGIPCVTSQEASLGEADTDKTFSLPAVADCTDPLAMVILTDAKGNLLDKREYQFKSNNQTTTAISSETKQGQKSVMAYGIIFIVILTIIALGAIFFKKKFLIVFFLIFSGIFWRGEQARADTLGNFVIGLNKSVYAPGETIIVTATDNQAQCLNAGHIYNDLFVTINGIEYVVFLNSSGEGISTTVYASAPAAPGSYVASFRWPTIWGTYDIPYIVVAPCVPSCASAASYCTWESISDGCSGSCTGTRLPDCSGRGGVCVGVNYPVACGTCTGTKPPLCSDANLHCTTETYASTNGCGNCTGTWDCTLPTCSASFSPTQLTTAGTSTLTLDSSATADNVYAFCNGPIAGGWWSATDFSSGVWFAAGQIGTETCTFQTYNRSLAGGACSATVTTYPAATVNITATSPIPFGGSPTFNLSSTNASSCTVSVDGTIISSGPVNRLFTYGPYLVAGLHNVSATCLNAIGAPASATTSFIVEPAPVATITVVPNPVACGSSTIISLASTNATNCTVSLDGVAFSSGPTTLVTSSGPFFVSMTHSASAHCVNAAGYPSDPVVLFSVGACHACGTAATFYPYSLGLSDWPGGVTFCAPGVPNPTNPSFPVLTHVPPNTKTTWLCENPWNAADNESCTAERQCQPDGTTRTCVPDDSTYCTNPATLKLRCGKDIPYHCLDSCNEPAPALCISDPCPTIQCAPCDAGEWKEVKP